MRGQIDSQLQQQAAKATLPNLKKWLEDPQVDRISPRAKAGIAAAIEAGQWEAIVSMYRRDLSFGTGGIRGMMALDRRSIELLRDEGLDAPILKGPNTLNNLVLLGRFQRGRGSDAIRALPRSSSDTTAAFGAAISPARGESSWPTGF